MKTMNNSVWLQKMAAAEEKHTVSVGGWITSIDQTTLESQDASTKSAFRRFLQLKRRERRLTLEQFAEKADIDLGELLQIEEGEAMMPRPRTIHNLAQFLNVSDTSLAALAGLVTVKDTQFTDATMRFAARSQPLQKLSKEEQDALEELVKVLGQL